MMPANSLDERGYFWWTDEPIPDGAFAPESGADGRLTISEDGRICLELQRRLSLAPNLDLDEGAFEFQRIDRRISGILQVDDRTVLLVDGRRRGTFSWHGERYEAERCLVSRKARAKLTEIPIKTLAIPLDGYEDWLLVRSIRCNRTESTVSVEHEMSAPHRYEINGDTVAISFDLQGPKFGEYKATEVRLRETASIKYTFEEPVPWSGVPRKHRSVEELLLLLTNVGRSLGWPRVEGPDETGAGTLYFVRTTFPNEEVYRDRWLTSFRHVADQFGNIMENWIKKSNTIGPGFYFYLATRRGRDIYTEHRFTTLISGLEALHRDVFVRTENARLKEKICRIVGDVKGKDDRKWLERKLQHALEPSLADRIAELLTRIPFGFEKGRVKLFSEKCAGFRNRLLHRGKVGAESPSGITEGDYQRGVKELAFISEVLSFLYHALILIEIGAPEGMIRHLIEYPTEEKMFLLWKVGLVEPNMFEEPKRKSIEELIERFTAFETGHT